MGLLWQVVRSGGVGSYRSVLAHHLPLACVTGVGLLLAAILPSDGVPYAPCMFLRFTGYPCPSCGLTRGFIAMAHGQFLSALQMCPLAALLYVATACVFAFNMAALLCGVRLIPGRLLEWRTRTGVIGVCIFGLLILLNWLYRLALGLK